MAVKLSKHKKAKSNKGFHLWDIKAQTVLNNSSVTIGIMVSSKLTLLFAIVLWASVSSNNPNFQKFTYKANRPRKILILNVKFRWKELP